MLDDDWRKEKLLAIRAVIRSHAPALKEHIRYKMLAYGDEPSLFALNAQKGYVSLYVGDIERIDPSGKMLQAFDVGKGCIRIKKSVDLHATELEAFIRKAVEIWGRGGDTLC